MLCNAHSCGLQVTLSVGLSAVVCIMAEVIPSHTDGTPHIAQGMQNTTYNQNPVYTDAEESLQADPISRSDYSQNPAYGLISNPNLQY